MLLRSWCEHTFEIVENRRLVHSGGCVHLKIDGLYFRASRQEGKLGLGVQTVNMSVTACSWVNSSPSWVLRLDWLGDLSNDSIFW